MLRTTLVKAGGLAAAIAADTLIRRMTQYSFRNRGVVMTGGSPAWAW